MIFVDELKQNYGKYKLPLQFVDCLPDVCDDCGSPLWIGETLTGLSCSNPRCTGKIVKRIEAISEKLGVKGFAEARKASVVNHYSVTNPLAIFELREGMPLSANISQEVSDGIIKQIQAKNSFLLWEYVQMAQLPFIQTSARKIFQEFDSLEDAYDEIEFGEGLFFVQNRLGIVSGEEVSIMASKIYTILLEFKEDLFEGLEFVNIRTLGDVKELNVVCSDQVGGRFAKKNDFYEFCRTEFGDRYHINFLGSVSKTIDYLVWAGADGSPARYTNKVKTVEKWNDKGERQIPIVTAEELISILDG